MFSVINHSNKPIKIWDGKGTIPMEDDAIAQLKRIAEMPFVPMVAAMPDLHLGKGAAVGSVIPSIGAVIPAAVGVDLEMRIENNTKDDEYGYSPGYREEVIKYLKSKVSEIRKTAT